eukprot:6190887-Pleurochrysis_carterae.AAC.4
MHMRRAGCAVNAVRRKEVAELVRRELPRVIAMQCSDDMPRRIVFLVQERSEGRHEATHVSGRLRLALEEMNGLETCVIIDEHQQVLIAYVASTDEGSGNVGVDEAPSSGRLALCGVVSVTGRVGLCSGRASVKSSECKSGRCIGGDGW